VFIQAHTGYVWLSGLDGRGTVCLWRLHLRAGGDYGIRTNKIGNP
jgi:hypothetical protein